MELDRWRNILLLWVSECNFIQKNYTEIEQSDIESFFAVYVKHASVGWPGHQQSTNLLEFLKELYPDFSPLFDNNGRIATSDNVFIYTLLMHYTCVKNPNEYFHTICKNLPDLTQQWIAAFFQQTVDAPLLTRDRLCSVIDNLSSIFEPTGALTDPVTPPRGRLSTSSPKSSSRDNSAGYEFDLKKPMGSSTANEPIGTLSTPSPIATPAGTRLHKSNISNSDAPPTPKTELLELRTRELRGLRAQLETERYEKNVLEEQIMDNEHLINSLSRENQLKKEQLAKIKATMENGSDDSTRNYVPNELEHLKRSLLKEINSKEAIIAEKNELLLDLNAEKCDLSAKLKTSEKQLKVCMDLIQELESKSVNLKQSIVDKNDEIKTLENEKLELEHCLQETREVIHNRREVLDASSDALNTSLSAASMNTTPESLATSVIDKQLREKERENEELRGELSILLQSKGHMAREFVKLLKQLSAKYNLKLECEELIEPETMAKHEIQLKVISLAMHSLGANFEKEQERVNKLQDESAKLSQRNTELLNDIKYSQKNIEELRENLSEAISTYAALECCKSTLEETTKQQERSLLESCEINTKLQENVQKLTEEVQELRQELAQQKANQNAVCQGLQCAIDSKTADYKKACAESVQKSKELASLQKKLDANVAQHDLDLQSLNTQLEKHRVELEQHMAAELVLKEKHEELVHKHDALRYSYSEADNHLIVMRRELSVKEQQFIQLGEEIQAVCAKNTDLEERINTLIADHSTDMAKAQALEAQHGKKVSQLADELSQEKTTHKLVREKYILCKAQLDSRDKCLSQLLDRLNVQEQESLLQHIEEMLQEKTAMQSNIKKLQDAKKSHTATIEELEKRLANSLDLQQVMLKNYEDQLQSLRDELDTSRRDFAEATSRAEAVRQRNNDFVLKIKNDLQERQIQVNQTMAEREEEFKQKIDKLNAELQAECKRTAALQVELENAAVKHGSDKQQLAQLQKMLEQCSAEVLQTEQSYIYEINLFCKSLEGIIEGHCGERAMHAPDRTDEETGDSSGNGVALFKSRIACVEGLVLQALNQKTEEIANLNRQRRIDQRDYAGLQQQLTSETERATALFNQLQNEIALLTSKNADLLSENQHAHSCFSHMEAQREALITKLEHTVNTLRATMMLKDAELMASAKKCDQTLEHLTAANAELMEDRESIVELMTKLSNSMERLEAQDVAAIEMVALLSSHIGQGDGVDCAPDQSSELGNNFKQLQSKLQEFVHNYVQLVNSQAAVERKYQVAMTQVNDLARIKEQLEAQVARQIDTVHDLQEKLHDEMHNNNSKLTVQIKHLDATIQNLEDVNEKLTSENTKMHSLLTERDQSLRLCDEKLQQLTNLHNTECKAVEMRVGALEKIQADLTESVRDKQAELQQLNKKCEELLSQLDQQTVLCEQLTEQTEQHGKLLAAANDERQRVETELNVVRLTAERKSTVVDELKFAVELHRNELSELRSDKDAAQMELQQLQASYDTLQVNLEEAVKAKQNAEHAANELENKLIEAQETTTKLMNNYAEAKQQHDNTQLELNNLRKLKTQLEEELQLHSTQLTVAREAEAELCQQNVALSAERDNLLAERQLLTEQVTASIANTSATVEREQEAQQLRRNLLMYENEVKSVRGQLVEQRLETSKVEQEAKRASDQLILSNKRVEQMAIKLGELQATISKQQGDLKQSRNNLEVQTKLEAALQREKAALREELRRSEELAVKASRIESDKVLAEERLAKLEKLRDSQLKKLYELNDQLAEAETLKVRLNHEIGGLNSDIEQRKLREANLTAALNAANAQQAELRNKLGSYEKQGSPTELAELRNSQGMLKQRLALLESECARQTKAAQQLGDERSKLAKELNQLQLDKKLLNEIIESHDNARAQMESELQMNKVANDALIMELKQKIKRLEQTKTVTGANSVEQRKKIAALEQQLDEYKRDLIELRNKPEESQQDSLLMQLSSERELVQKYQLDCQILQVKYKESRDEILRADQRLKDQRIELESKLEKMKDKMKTLYNEEITRLKLKQEQEVTKTKTDLEALSAKNLKYEEHTRKLSSQIVRLNEKILESQKHEAMLTTKLRHLQSQETSQAAEDQPFKRPSSFLGVAAAAAAGPLPAVNLGTNLAMEDEEGEVFNNTYLTDLKLGRVPNMTAEELQYRNSLQPPHLKSAYAAQYDVGAHEDDLKDAGPHSLDDSMSALLSTTGGAAGRKKSMGGTHYKRPGPPTPSKHGGRLSFGGSSEPAREILREAIDAGNTAGSAKTPARFKLFASRFSMGGAGGGAGSSLHNTRDERSHRMSKKDYSLLKHLQQRKFQGHATTVFCTSTPRKSGLVHDQRRLSFMRNPPTEQQTADNPLNNEVPTTASGIPIARVGACRRRTSTGGSSSTPSSAGTAPRRSTGRARHRKQGPRLSIYLPSNIFVKNRPQSKLKAPQRTSKFMQQQQRDQKRLTCYDQARQLGASETEQAPSDDDAVVVVSQQEKRNTTYKVGCQLNNNYELLDRNSSSFETVGMSGDMSDNLPDESDTDGSDQTTGSASIAPGSATFDVTPNRAVAVRLTGTRSSPAALQQFEDTGTEYITNWLEQSSQHDQRFEFEQLCRRTASTAPFTLNTLDVSDYEEAATTSAVLPQAAVSHSTTGNASAHGLSNITNASSTTSHATHSHINMQVYRLPHISITTLERPLDSRVQPTAADEPFNAADLCQMWRLMNFKTRCLFVLTAGLFISLYGLLGGYLATGTATIVCGIVMLFAFILDKYINV